MKQTDLSRYDNAWYRPGASWKRALWIVVNALVLQNPLVVLSSVKRVTLRMFGARIGRGVVIKPRVNVKYPWLLTIGDFSWIGEGVWIDNLAWVEIGTNCCVSQGALLLCGNHDYKKSTFDLMIAPIVLEDGAWIGAKAIVAPGVRCGSHAVLVAGSVASTDLEPYGIYRGNPAERVKARVIVE